MNEKAKNFYINNKETINNYICEIIAYNSINNFLSNPSENEYMILSESAINAYRKFDDNKFGLREITDFLTINYIQGYVTLEDIKNADYADIINGFLNNEPSELIKHEIDDCIVLE